MDGLDLGTTKKVLPQGLIDWCLMLISTVFQLYRGGQCTYPCFSEVLLTSTLYNILSNPLAVFPYDHCRNNGQG